MRSDFKAAVYYIVLLVAIVGAFKLYKTFDWISIPEKDKSLSPEFPTGNYWFDSRKAHQGPFSEDNPVLYLVPNRPDTRFGWIVATEGQQVEWTQGQILIDGKAPAHQPIKIDKESSPWRIPRGCVFVISNDEGVGSIQYGPIPVENIRGSLKQSGTSR